MATLDVNGTSINYVVEGNGPTVVLVHGFASNLQANWRAPGIIDALVASGRQVVALDCRGHGRSDKPHDPAAYEGTQMTDDVLALMDHLDIMQADLAGYSMGGILAATLLVRAPMRFRSVVLAGIGNTLLTRGPNSERAQAIARAMEADDSGASESATARGFRQFAEQSGNDLQALAAMQRATRSGFDVGKLAAVELPVMVLIGAADTLAGPADELAAAIPGAMFVNVPGDHLTAVAAPEFTHALVAFLVQR